MKLRISLISCVFLFWVAFFIGETVYACSYPSFYLEIRNATNNLLYFNYVSMKHAFIPPMPETIDTGTTSRSLHFCGNNPIVDPKDGIVVYQNLLNPPGVYTISLSYARGTKFCMWYYQNMTKNAQVCDIIKTTTTGPHCVCTLS